MLKNNFILGVIMTVLFVSHTNAIMLNAHSFKFDEAVAVVYDFAQTHSGVIQLSNEFVVLYNRFQNQNYELTTAQYMKFRLEVFTYNKLIAQNANTESMSQAYIDLHS